MMLGDVTWLWTMPYDFVLVVKVSFVCVSRDTRLCEWPPWPSPRIRGSGFARKAGPVFLSRSLTSCQFWGCARLLDRLEELEVFSPLSPNTVQSAQL